MVGKGSRHKNHHHGKSPGTSIGHQGDEGADHDGAAFLDEGWKLVAEGLAASGGHDHENMLAGHQAFDHLLLLALELIETEKLAQTLLYG